MEAGLAWGRGFQWRERWGWMGVEASYNLPRSPAEAEMKLDATIGIGVSDRSKLMLQLFNSRIAGESYHKLAPSLLYKPRENGPTYQLSSEIPLTGGAVSLKLGLWFNF